MQENHTQTHPPLEVRDVPREVTVSGDEDNPGSVSVSVSKPSHQSLDLEVHRILPVGGNMEDVDLGLVELLQHPFVLLGDVTDHSELSLAVVEAETLLSDLVTNTQGRLTAGHLAVLDVPENSEWWSVLDLHPDISNILNCEINLKQTLKIFELRDKSMIDQCNIFLW